jgi:hypothetical protein
MDRSDVKIGETYWLGTPWNTRPMKVRVLAEEEQPEGDPFDVLYRVEPVDDADKATASSKALDHVPAEAFEQGQGRGDALPARRVRGRRERRGA